MRKLESYDILDVFDQVVARTIVEIGWLDIIIGDICIQRDQTLLAQKKDHLSTRLAELQEETSKVQQMLKEVRFAVSLKNFSSGSLDNYRFFIIWDN